MKLYSASHYKRSSIKLIQFILRLRNSTRTHNRNKVRLRNTDDIQCMGTPFYLMYMYIYVLSLVIY